MTRLSKADRKRLWKAYDESIRDAYHPAYVVSPGATPDANPPSALVREASRFRVNLVWRPTGPADFVVAPPSAPSHICCNLSYGGFSQELSADLQHLEDLRGHPASIPLGARCIELSGQINLHPANQFIYLTMLRVLGKRTQGTLIDLSRGFIMDDWLSWSLDYMEQDMFLVKQVYDPEPYDFRELVREFPSLRKRRFWFF
jgi:hypothetical protein